MSDQFLLIKNDGVEQKLSVDEFEFDLVGSDERQMGTQNQYELNMSYTMMNSIYAVIYMNTL